MQYGLFFIYFEKENISTRDFADEFLLNILSGVAEEESRQISSNLRWTFKKTMSKGLNTTVRIYGYRIVDSNFIIIPRLLSRYSIGTLKRFHMHGWFIYFTNLVSSHQNEHAWIHSKRTHCTSARTQRDNGRGSEIKCLQSHISTKE